MRETTAVGLALGVLLGGGALMPCGLWAAEADDVAAPVADATETTDSEQEAGPSAADAPYEVDGDGDTARPDARERPRVRWEDHRTVFDLENAHIELHHRVQFRFTYEKPDDEVQLPGATDPGQGIGAFRVRRAKTAFEGWFWKPELKYELQLSWAGPEAGASTDTALEDFLLMWDVSKVGALHVVVGQYKVPLGRQEMSSSSTLQFCDRSLLTYEFTRGRDFGVMVGGSKGPLEYWAGMFNGNPASRQSNDNAKFQYNGRLMLQPFGDAGYSEGDPESSPKPLLAVAVQAEHNDLSGATNGNDLRTLVLGGDVVFKYRGFSLLGEYFYRDRKPEEGASFASPGFNVQAGYFVVPGRLELAVRYAGWDPTDAADGDAQREKGVALSYLLQGHYLKIQADLRQLNDEWAGERSYEVRLQTYVQF